MSELHMKDKASISWEEVNSNDAKQAINKPRKQRKTVGIPTMGALSAMTPASYFSHIEKEPTPWERIENYTFYSPSADGSRLMMKVNCSKSLDIKTQKTMPTVYGQAYIVHLDASPSKADF